VEDIFFRTDTEEGPQVKLAGYNIDVDEINAIPDDAILTPETISAAYARISRSSDDLSTLRKKAREDLASARKLNSRIVYEYGHSSVAEHAYFNIDITRLSRLAIESLEHFRFASYTEKSQRYVVFFPPDITIPEEITDDKDRQDFYAACERLFRSYGEVNIRLKEYFGGSRSDAHPAQEDARYLLPLATRTQVGLSINARSLERMIGRLAASPLSEVRLLGSRLYREVAALAPSLIRYTEPHPYYEKKPVIASSVADRIKEGQVPLSNDDVSLEYHTPQGEELLVSLLIHEKSGLPLRASKAIVDGLNRSLKEEVIRETFIYQEAYQDPPRQFEVLELGFDIVLSATAFAQMKRHRLATIIKQPYINELGQTMPMSFDAVGFRDEWVRIQEEILALNERLRKRYGDDVASYILTNGQKRRIFIRFNLRNFFSFCRLRLDIHSQWDIRRIAIKMVELVRDVYPLTSIYLSGKDSFKKVI